MYFKNITTKDELKKEYRRLSLIHHPDKGGDQEDFKAMSNEYQDLKQRLECNLGHGIYYQIRNNHYQYHTEYVEINETLKESIIKFYKNFFKTRITKEEFEELFKDFNI